MLAGLVLVLTLGFNRPALAQDVPSSMALGQLSADERVKLRSMLKNREFSVGRSADGAATVGSGLTPQERRALRKLLRELDAVQIRRDGLPGDQINIEAMNDADRLADPIAANESRDEEPSPGWPLVDSIGSHRQDSDR